MKFLLPLAGALVVLGVAILGTRGHPESSAPPPKPVVREREGTSASAEPETPRPVSYSASAAGQIAQRLDELRRREEARRVVGTKPSPEEAREEEARRTDVAALAESLREFLVANPETWPDVFRQVSGLDSLMSVLEISVMISPVVDPAFEPQLIRILREGEQHRIARRAAVALLADSPTVEALQSFIDTAQMDHDSAVRHAAFLQMVRRKSFPEFRDFAPIIEDTVLRLSNIEPDITVRGLMSRWLPGNAPPVPEFKPRSKGGPRTSSKKK